MYSKHIHTYCYPPPHPSWLFELFLRESTAAYSAGREFLEWSEIARLWLWLALEVLVGIEATWEWHLLIFIKSRSSLDHISAWVYTHSLPAMCTHMLLYNYGIRRGVCVCICVHVCICLCMCGACGYWWCFCKLIFSCGVLNEKVLFKKS